MRTSPHHTMVITATITFLEVITVAEIVLKQGGEPPDCDLFTVHSIHSFAHSLEEKQPIIDFKPWHIKMSKPYSWFQVQVSSRIFLV